MKDSLSQTVEKLAATDIGKFYFEEIGRELQLAGEMQKKLLPNATEINAIEDEIGFRISSWYQPSRSVGGDFWGIQKLNKTQVLIYVIDFSGHGLAAALNTFLFYGLLKNSLLNHYDLVRCVKRLNKNLYDLTAVDQYATMIFGIVDHDNHEFSYVASSAPDPIVYCRESEKFLTGDGSGLPLGIKEDAKYKSRKIPFTPNSSLYLHTDGLFSGPRFAKKNPEKLVSKAIKDVSDEHGLKVSADLIAKKINFNSPVVPYDDTTLVIIDFLSTD